MPRVTCGWWISNRAPTRAVDSRRFSMRNSGVTGINWNATPGCLRQSARSVSDCIFRCSGPGANGSRRVSKQQFEAELEVARRLRGTHPSKRRRSQEEIGKIEVRVVQQVEGLQPELHPHGLGECEILQKRNVDILQAGTGHDVAARVAKCPFGRNHKSGCVE